MGKIILTMLLLIPMSLDEHKLMPLELMNKDFNSLLLVCLHGGHASIWIDHKPIAYVACNRVAFPKRFPR